MGFCVAPVRRAGLRCTVALAGGLLIGTFATPAEAGPLVGVWRVPTAAMDASARMAHALGWVLLGVGIAPLLLMAFERSRAALQVIEARRVDRPRARGANSAGRTGRSRGVEAPHDRESKGRKDAPRSAQRRAAGTEGAPCEPARRVAAAKPKLAAAGRSAADLAIAAEMLAKLGQHTPIRHELVQRVRQEIRAGAYDTPDKIDQAVDRLLAEIDG